ncbi:uncharacterized protein LOC129232405 [Uloborus diversus]|uniref:uncharacterized protein LOC129232405 n=1 Tax=Uloborus diversus TaxID=327109 RepID=UPI0024093FC5|nr:uncharacterized protein LOC129232405 [Uloborus diversus]
MCPIGESELSPSPRSRLAELREGAWEAGDSGSPPDVPPPWLDRQMFDRARHLFKMYFFSIFFSHLSGLMLIVHLPSMTDTLLSTGHSSSVVSLFRRYLSTLIHIRHWYEGDIWDVDDPAHQSITHVRAMHRRVADRLNDGNQSESQPEATPENDSPRPILSVIDKPRPNTPKNNVLKDRVAISQYDMALTQFAFVGLVIMNPKHVGLPLNRNDLKCLVHFWRAIGYMLGVEDRYNLCNEGLDEAINTCKDILECELKPSLSNASKDSSVMSKGIIQAMNSFIIFLSWEAMARFWYEKFNLKVGFPMGAYEKVGYWLMRFTFGWLLRWQVFHSFFNFLLRIAVRQALNRKEYFEGWLIRRYKLDSM